MCDVAIQSPSHSARRRIHLSSRTDYTGTVDFADLAAGTTYDVEVLFSLFLTRKVSGRFSTFPTSRDDPASYSFVLSSCNLSVVSINNLLAFLLTIAGVRAAKKSLELPLDRWRFRGLVWLWAVLRFVILVLLMLVALFIKKLTRANQPAPPYLRSPFLKLSAVFESQVLDVVTTAALRPAVGDVVYTSSAAGVVACSVEEVASDRISKDCKKILVPEQRENAADAHTGEGDTPSTWRLVLTQVEGTFVAPDAVSKRPAGRHKREEKRHVGTLCRSRRGRVWFDRPAFFMHAGDQIYYDFPFEDRAPKKGLYRLAYREAWFDDFANGHILSHWPHYMTLDDHEIADQFARDFKPQADKVTPLDYLREAGAAYREYVQSRNPSRDGCVDRGRRSGESYWYCFDKGRSRFFVLDTRTQRFDRGVDGPQMIDAAQMRRLLEWMTRYKDDLKFVVTSVPFVAEINDHPSKPSPKWNSQDQSTGEGGPAGQRRNPINDKWCAPRFARQRSEIIEHIATHNIEHLVFLTGDMHCCYYASMRIGGGSKYDSNTIHELGAGPVNQLQLTNVSEFHTRRIGRTTAGIPFEVVLERFHGEVNAVMHLKVSYDRREQIIGPRGPALTPKVEWNVIRTLTDDGPSAWDDDASSGERSRVDRSSPDGIGVPPVRRPLEATMAGQISFVKKRNLGDLHPWPA